MLRLARAQLKAQRGRYTAMVMAIIVGIAFFTASLAGVSSSQATLNNSLGAMYKNSTVLVTRDTDDLAALDRALSPQLLQRVQSLPQVEHAYYLRRAYGELTTQENQRRTMTAIGLPNNVKQFPFTLVTGSTPRNPHEVVIDQASAEKYQINLRDEIKTEFQSGDEPSQHMLKVSGIIRTLHTPQLAGTIQIFAQEELLTQVQAAPVEMVIRTAPQDADVVASQIAGTFTPTEIESLKAITVEGYITDQSSSGGDFLPIAMVLTVFSLIAMAVMTLVINNTFAVIIVQRTRELGLLRIVGSTKAQVFRTVLGEAFLIGLISSAIGVLIGLGLLAGALALAGAIWNIDFIAFTATPASVLWPLLVGTLATLLAAWRPARNATKVQPVAALAPELLETGSKRLSVLRIISGLLLLGLGAAGLYFFVFVEAQLFLAMVVGLVSFIGVLVLTPAFIPALVSVFGQLFKPLGVPGAQARLNAVRHPRRSATTAAALLIGTTLIMMMITGAETVKHSVNETMDEAMPVDVYVQASGTDQPLSPEQALANASELVKKHTGNIVPVSTMTAANGRSVLLVDQEEMKKVNRLGLAGPASGEVFTRMVPAGETMDLGSVKLTAKESPFMYPLDPLANKADFPTGDQELGFYLVQLSAPLASSDLEDYRDELAKAFGVEPTVVFGSIFERAMFEQIINVLLSIVNAMLAVALIIAFIGVTNTLTLSTIERQRENGLMRAIGLTKSGLRSMLTLEALLISMVAVLVGCVLGVIYGWLGANAVMVTDEAKFVVPWLAIAATIVVALACAMLAATVPARRALKLEPVQALTE
ncbi:ABC transporter permease [Micrococcoides hystricis]|uniref:ABC transporter permease n=1 Tax=Micrococcoides hystricis TaxID=1572761 RepID=A0ABV6PE25_9MICC